VLFLANPDDLMIDLLRGRGTAARGVDVEDDGFDAVVVAEFTELRVDFVGVDDDAADVDDGDAVGAEGGGGCVVGAVQGGPE
jgi:hypothetical protein